MLDYGLSLTRAFPYKDRIEDSVLIRENTGQKKNRILEYFTQCVSFRLLTHSFPMFSFDPPENIRKRLVFMGIKR